MKREIKFRVWDNKSKKYFKPIYETFKGKLLDLSIDLNGDLLRRTLQKPAEHESCFEDQYILEQFTGRQDSDINGTDVYKNDIIENCDSKDLQIVYWNNDEAAWYCRYIYDEARIVSLADSLGNLNKVIGNIHENPELLK